MSDTQPEAPRDDERVAPAAGEAPSRRPLPIIPSLQMLDLGADGLACDIDGPDCVLPGAMADEEGDA